MLIPFLSSCGVVKQVNSRDRANALNKLEVGMTKQQVLDFMGEPYGREVYGSQEFLIYDTNHWGNTEAERFTPICLVDGKVIGWGRNYYDSSKKYKIESDIRVKSE